MLSDIHLNLEDKTIKDQLLNSVMRALKESGVKGEVEKIQALLELIVKFLDRYELKRNNKEQMKWSQNTIQVTVTNYTDQKRKQIQVPYFGTIHYIRQEIGKVFDLELREFTMHYGKVEINPDDYDDKLIKDAYYNQISIVRDENYDREQHPKNALA